MNHQMMVSRTVVLYRDHGPEVASEVVRSEPADEEAARERSRRCDNILLIRIDQQ